MNESNLRGLLRQAPVLPVLVVEDIGQAVPLANCLVDAGLPVLEITLRSAVAVEAIRRIVAEVEHAIVGAGTVLDAAGMRAVKAAGARFAIAPGATPTLYAAARDAELPFLPAVATASELMLGLEQGSDNFKLFPAAALGGTALLRAFAGPFPAARFCPTGGIDAASAPDYLALHNVLTVGGSWMVPAALLAAGRWEEIGRLASEAAALRRSID